MELKTVYLSLVVLLFFALDASAAEHGLAPKYLRTEYRVEPLGIESQQPRLSWIVESAERGQRQTAYRVLVASSEKQLSKDVGDLWDSGKVESNETSVIEYAGKPLASRSRCHWKVKVWDKGGKSCGWSSPAFWSMGLLNKADWEAKWIGYDRPAIEAKSTAPNPLADANWIWYPEGEPAKAAPVAQRFFRQTIELPADRNIISAVMFLASDITCSGFVNGEHIGDQSGFGGAKRFDFTAKAQPGTNWIAVAVTNKGDQPNPGGVIGAVLVKFSAGEPLLIVTDASWLAAKKNAAGWMVGKDADTKWASAMKLVPNGGAPWTTKVVAPSLRLPPPRYLRTEFALKKPIRRATVYGTAQGIYELRLNGKRVSEDYFSPGWTDYNKRIYYQTYDVTELVQAGENALGAVLADGWFAGYLGYRGDRDLYGDKLRLLTQLEIEFEDGTKQIVATGPRWKANTGPLAEADFLMGEYYDARRELTGWDKAGLADTAWHAVDVTDSIAARVQAYPSVPVRELDPIKPVEISEPTPGNIVINMGQNFAGMVRIKVRGKAGQKIRIRHAERLNPDGTIYTANLRSVRAMDTYVCRGDEDGEWWQPRFTFHGFQYVEVTGYPGKLTAEDLIGIPVSSDTPVVGSVECSDKMVNKLFNNIYWTQRMNFIDIPTDCPQRDERLGWTGDAQIYVRTASMICDTQSFFTKWLVDLNDAQREDGQYPMVAPLKSAGVSADGGPAWADAGVVCPWNIFQVYGDRRQLRSHYDNMSRFISFCEKRCTPELLPPEKFHCFGDWLNIDDDTPKPLIFTAYFAQSTRMMSEIATALGKMDDAKRFADLYERIKVAFNKAYVSADNRLEGDTQTAYVLALAVDLVDGERREAAASRLVELIEGRGWRLSTGFIGTKDLMLVLNKIDRNDVAYRLLHNTSFPSWGFSIQNGATSIWERWNGWTPEKGFFNPAMNSFAHYSFGAVAQWMFEVIGGIKSDGPGFDHMVIRPIPGGKLTWANVSYRSRHGLIESRWKITHGKLTMDVKIPANTTAEIHIPNSEAEQVTESGRPIESAQGVEFLRSEGGAAVFEVESGKYTFAAPWTK